METIVPETDERDRWVFKRGLRLRVVEYNASSPPVVGGLLYSVGVIGDGLDMKHVQATMKPWVCLGRYEVQPWHVHARLWLQAKLGG